MSDHEPPATPERTNPFPGLRPFEPEEAHLFFGREGQTDELLRRLQKTRFLAVVGTSGSGKSSLVRAGLLPALHGGYMVGEGSTWQIALMRPGNDPIGNLARHLQPIGQSTPPTEEDPNQVANEDWEMKQAILEASLHRSARGLVEATKQLQLGAHENLLVVVDQFEELFRFQKDIRGGKEEAAAFVKLLLEATAQRDVPIFVVITMRSDFLGDCAQFRDLPEALNDGQYLIPRMTRDQRQASMTGPAAVGGGEMTPRLVQRLLNDLGDDPDQLPVLQHALMRTWDHREQQGHNGVRMDVQDYEAVGELNEALSRHADEAYLGLPDERSQVIAKRLFQCLTERGPDNREIRRPMTVERIAKVADATPEEVILIIERFRSHGRSFLIPPLPQPITKDSLIDISHESLIRQWDRLRSLVYQEAESWALYRRLMEAAMRYQEGLGGLWRDPELSLAVQWQEQQEPNPAWAELYGGKFQEVQAFLTKSEAGRRAEQRIKHAQMGLVGFLVLAIIGALWWGLEVQRQSVKDIEAKKDQIEAALTEAEHRRLDAETAKEQAELAEDKATQALTALEEATQRQVELTQDAENERDRAEAAADAERVAKDRAKQQTELAKREAERAREGAIQTAASEQLGKDPTLGSLILTNLHSARIPHGGLQTAYELERKPVARQVLKGHTSRVYHAAFSPDGRWVVTASRDGTARVWRADGTGEPVVLTGNTSEVNHAAFSPDGEWVVTASRDGTARVWRADGSGTPVVLTGHTDGAYHAAFSPDGEWVVTASRDGTVRVGRADGTGAPVVLTGHTGGVNHAAFSPDGEWVVTASWDGMARVWRADGTGTPVVLTGHTDGAYHAAFSPDGEWVVTASRDGTVRVWRADGTGAPVSLKGHTDGVYHAAFSLDGEWVVTASDDGTARVWRADGTGAPVVLTGHTSGVYHAAFSPDGEWVVTASDDGTARVWRADGTGIPVGLKGHTSGVTHAAFSPDGQWVVTASRDRTARVWRADGSGTPVVLTGHTDGAYHAAFSPDGEWVVTASRDGTVRVGRADGTGAPVVLTGHTGGVNHAAFSPDGEWVVTASWDGMARVWRADGTGTPVVLTGHTDGAYHAAFSPDGEWVVTASRDGTVRVGRADGTGAPVVLTGHTGGVNHAAFSPDGEWVVTASWDGMARVWRADGTGTPVMLTGHTDGVNHAAFSPDGEWVVTASRDGMARVWRVGWKSLLKTLREQTNACLTKAQRVRYLFEEEPVAQERYESCERHYGRLK